MSKIEKTVARQKEKIAEGQFYEAHQQLRVIASRYVKQSNNNAAIDILFGGAQLLLNAGQGGSGGDLCLYLMDVYKTEEVKPDAASKGRLLTLFRSFPSGELTKKRFVGEAIGWSAKFGEFPAGDPELHHVAGKLYAEEGDAYEAERHLALGTRDSAPILANLEYTWYSSDAPHTAGQYAARAVFPYLLTGNLRAANAAFLLFITRLSSAGSAPTAQPISSTNNEARVYPSIPLLNFLSLLLLAVQKGTPDLFRLLRQHYSSSIADSTEGVWDEALEHIAEMYFGIRQPRQSNPLMDMMSSMFGGGGGGAAAPKPRGIGQAPAPPPTLD